MVAVIKRMRKLRELLWIRNGPGAIKLPKEVTKISLEFNKKLVGAQHRGARHFWHEMLPRIKYRNPTIPISVTRHNDPENAPCYLHIFTSSASSPSSAQSANKSASAKSTPETTSSSQSISILTMNESEILEALIEKTGAVKLQPPPEEVEEQAAIDEWNVKAEKDRTRVRDNLIKARREEELLKIAKRGGSTAA